MGAVEISLEQPFEKPKGAIAYLKNSPVIITEIPIERIASYLLGLCKKHEIGYWRDDRTKINLTLRADHDVDVISSEILELLETIHARSIVEDQE